MRRSFASGSALVDEQRDSSEAFISSSVSSSSSSSSEELYLSSKQKEALEEIWKNPKCSLLTILPVGGGKTALFNELAKLNRNGEVSIMISPYRALLANQLHRAKQEGLRTLHCHPGANLELAVEIDRIWNAARGLPTPYAQALYLTPEQLQRGTIFSLLLNALATHNLVRMIFVDEVHELVSGVASYYEARFGPDSQQSHHGDGRDQHPWRRGAALAVQNLIHDIRSARGNQGHVRVVLATATATESERAVLVAELLNHGRPSQYPAPKSIITSAVFPAANLKFTTIFCRKPSRNWNHDSSTPAGYEPLDDDRDGYQATSGSRGRELDNYQTVTLSEVDATLAIIVSHFNSSSMQQQQQDKGQILICVRSRELTIELATELQRQYRIYAEQTRRRASEEGRNDGNLIIPTIAYWNSELSNDEIGRVITEWETGKLQVVVATPGFGTGIHNPKYQFGDYCESSIECHSIAPATWSSGSKWQSRNSYCCN